VRNLNWYAVGAITCALLMGTAFYFEYVQGLEPCPLCMFQRVFFVAIGLLCLIGWWHHPAGFAHRAYATVIGLLALGGAGVAGRQVWLQHLPADQVPECGPDLYYMLESFPLMKTISTVLRGSGDCAEVQWRFLGFSMAEWTLFIFLVMFAVSLLMLFNRERAHFI
jgi:disulfide bond formation protein DsbB